MELKLSLASEGSLNELFLDPAFQYSVVYAEDGPVKSGLTKAGINSSAVGSAARHTSDEIAQEVKFILPEASGMLQEGLGSEQRDYHVLCYMIDLGLALREEKQFDEAELVIAQAMRLAQEHKHLGPEPGTERFLTRLIRTCTEQLSSLYEDTGRYAEAEKYHLDFANDTDFTCISDLENIFRSLAESVSPSSLLRRAHLLIKQNQLDEAQVLYLRALESLEEEEKRFVAINQQDCHEIVHQLKRALGGFSSAGEQVSQTNGKSLDCIDTPFVQNRLKMPILTGLADVYLAKGDLEKAEKILAIAINTSDQNEETLIYPLGEGRQVR